MRRSYAVKHITSASVYFEFVKNPVKHPYHMHSKTTPSDNKYFDSRRARIKRETDKALKDCLLGEDFCLEYDHSDRLSL